METSAVIGSADDFSPYSNNRVDTKHEEDKFAGAVVTGIATSRDADEVAEADLETESRAPTPPPRSKKRLGPCSLCEAKESDAWWRCPGQTGTMWSNKEKLLCSDCSTQWRHCGYRSTADDDESR